MDQQPRYDPSSKFPPKDMVTPHVPHLAFTIILHLITLAFAVYGIRLWRTKKSPTLLLFLVGGYIASFMEPIVDINGMCYFPVVGQIVGIKSYGRPIPLFVVTTYSWFMGGQAYFFKEAFDYGRLTKSQLWTRWIALMGVNLILELPMLALKLYIYYGPAPFKIGGFPFYWAIVNTMIPLLGGFAAHLLSPVLEGWKQIFITLITPLADGFANCALGGPMWYALNSDYTYEATYPAFFAVLGVSCFCVWLISGYVTKQDYENYGSREERESLINSA